MRLILFCLLVFSSPITAVKSLASNQSPTLDSWEILENCRLVESPINDGDSFKLMHGDNVFTIRLYYVDCPETYDTYRDRLQDQAGYFSISEAEVITFGKTAKAYTEKFLDGEFTVITRWEATLGSESENMRYFGIVLKKNRLLSTELVSDGLARIYGMPAKGSWPGGVTPEVYLRQLKQSERTAQQAGKGIWYHAQKSTQLAALKQTGNRTEMLKTPLSTSGLVNTKKLVINTASTEELEELPGIGPVLADRIIAARPFTKIDKLAEIPGISIKKVDTLRHLILLDKPPPPPMTADFYLSDSSAYLNKDVIVRVSMVTRSELTTPEGFRAVHLETRNLGESGGSIPAFIPDEYYDSFINYYKIPNRKFTGLFFRQDDNIVLIYRRK